MYKRQVYAQEDPNRMIPADVLKDMEAEGKIGKLSDTLFVTSGNGCATNNAVAFGQAIAAELDVYKRQDMNRRDKVDAEKIRTIIQGGRK